MRAVHYCDVCEWRLPYCVRTDRRFCSSRCRVWSQRHPGIKRLYGSRGRVQLPQPPGKGQPKTFAAALLALAESRKYAAQLEATAKAQKAAEQKLTKEVAELRGELAQTKSHLTTARDQLTKAEQGLAQANQSTTVEINDLRKQLAEREATLKEAEDTAAKLAQTKSQLATVQDQLTKAEQGLAQANQSTAVEINDLRKQLAEREAKLKEAEDTAAKQRPLIEELTRDREKLRGRAESAERTLAQRDEDLARQSRSAAAAERANEEVQIVAELESRRLRAEKELRIAAEQQVEQLRRYLKDLAEAEKPAMTADGLADLHGKRADLLAAELRAVRIHSDEIDAEREHLAARILKLMAPGQYLAHAAAAGYDVTQDPLIRLKREEIRVENRYYAWQAARGSPKRARKMDPEQTLDEQAYAGAIALRWRLIDRPHHKTEPKWLVIGSVLDAKHEQHLLKGTQSRIKSIVKKLGGAWKEAIW